MGLWPLAHVKLEGRLPSSLHDKLTELPKITDVAAMVTTGYPVGKGRRVNPYARPHPPQQAHHTRGQRSRQGWGQRRQDHWRPGSSTDLRHLVWCW